MTVKEMVPARHPENRSLDEDLGSWWVLHIKPNCEKLIATYLLNRDISYYLPLYNRRVRLGCFSRVRSAEVPLFRGYLCFALDRERHSLLYDTHKFVRIIRVEDQEKFVSELQSVVRAVECGSDFIVRPGLVPGRRVLILSGPLEGTEGVVVRSRGDMRLALSVKMFNQSVLVRLDRQTELDVLS
jgi:transcription antitermination factor NusG